MLYIVDYHNPKNESVECLIVEADFKEDAMELAIDELKLQGIPKRYLIKLEEF